MMSTKSAASKCCVVSSRVSLRRSALVVRKVCWIFPEDGISIQAQRTGVRRM